MENCWSEDCARASWKSHRPVTFAVSPWANSGRVSSGLTFTPSSFARAGDTKEDSAPKSTKALIWRGNPKWLGNTRPSFKTLLVLVTALTVCANCTSCSVGSSSVSLMVSQTCASFPFGRDLSAAKARRPFHSSTGLLLFVALSMHCSNC